MIALLVYKLLCDVMVAVVESCVVELCSRSVSVNVYTKRRCRSKVLCLDGREDR